MGLFRRTAEGDPLPVTMAAVKLGDRFLAVGVRDAALIAVLAAKAGLTGTACAIDADADAVKKAAAAIEAGRRARRGDPRALGHVAVRRRAASTSPSIRDLLPSLDLRQPIAMRDGSAARAAPRRARRGDRARAARRIRRARQPRHRGREVPTARSRRFATVASRQSASSPIAMACSTSKGSRRLEALRRKGRDYRVRLVLRPSGGTVGRESQLYLAQVR